jgi:hypothetical protein
MGADLDGFIESVRGVQSAAHDFKFKFESDLHPCLCKLGFPTNEKNGGIGMEIPTADNSVIIKVSVYAKTTLVNVGCTYNPITWDADGAVRLTSILAKVRDCLLASSNYEARVPSVTNWILTQRHHGKDGKFEYSGELFNVTFEGLKGEMMRAYVKIMPDGRRIPRIERIVSSKNTFQREIESMLASNDEKRPMQSTEGGSAHS